MAARKRKTVEIDAHEMVVARQRTISWIKVNIECPFCHVAINALAVKRNPLTTGPAFSFEETHVCHTLIGKNYTDDELRDIQYHRTLWSSEVK